MEGRVDRGDDPLEEPRVDRLGLVRVRVRARVRVRVRARVRVRVRVRVKGER